MIRYTLKCEKNHHFDSWFPSAEGFERLRSAGLATCALCGSPEVEKALMSPQVLTGRARGTSPQAPTAASEPARPVALSAPDTPLAKAIARLRAEVEASSDYVGQDFAREARAMHLGDVPERPIHGEASLEEARALVQDGVPVLPLPFGNHAKSN